MERESGSSRCLLLQTMCAWRAQLRQLCMWNAGVTGPIACFTLGNIWLLCFRNIPAWYVEGNEGYSREEKTRTSRPEGEHPGADNVRRLNSQRTYNSNCPMALEEVVRREQVHYPSGKGSCHTVPCPTVEKTANASPVVKAIVSEKWQTFWRGMKRLGYWRSEAIDNDVQEALDQRWAQGRSDYLLCFVSCAPCLAGLCVVCWCGYGAVGRCGSDSDGVDGQAEKWHFSAVDIRLSELAEK